MSCVKVSGSLFCNVKNFTSLAADYYAFISNKTNDATGIYSMMFFARLYSTLLFDVIPFYFRVLRGFNGIYFRNFTGGCRSGI